MGMQDTAVPPPEFDPRRRFIRIVEVRANGMVEFEFAVGEPELFVEMILPREAFDDFCAREGVVPTQHSGALADSGGEGQSWTLHDARNQRLDRQGAENLKSGLDPS
jgi:phenol hydroxylase P0 protein